MFDQACLILKFVSITVTVTVAGSVTVIVIVMSLTVTVTAIITVAVTVSIGVSTIVTVSKNRWKIDEIWKRIFFFLKILKYLKLLCEKTRYGW